MTVNHSAATHIFSDCVNLSRLNGHRTRDITKQIPALASTLTANIKATDAIRKTHMSLRASSLARAKLICSLTHWDLFHTFSYLRRHVSPSVAPLQQNNRVVVKPQKKDRRWCLLRCRGATLHQPAAARCNLMEEEEEEEAARRVFAVAAVHQHWLASVETSLPTQEIGSFPISSVVGPKK